MTSRRIAVFTSTRAEYGLLRPLMREIAGRPGLTLQVIASGTHLSPQHGMTVREIEADGFAVDATVEMLLSSDSAVAATKSAALAMMGTAEALDRLRPDMLVLLGDRYELLAAAQAAVLARVPIAHVHGGEITEGAIDELIRHAVTKLAHLHFPAAEPYAQRLRQMGESHDRIWTVGALALDNIATLDLVAREALEQHLGLRLKSPSFLVTYHPVTTREDSGLHAMQSLLTALDELNATVVVTGTNADPGASDIRQALERFAAQRQDRVVLVESLGARRYLSLMLEVDAVVGNSSSGLLEAPAMGVTTVDIGSRQQGRLRAPSVIHCDDTLDSVRAALSLALAPEQQALAARRNTPYGKPGAARRIVDVLEATRLDTLEKPFINYTSALAQSVTYP
ncbi:MULTISPECIES: UDP-N-acetylglucosamine 2-epimerase [Pandoraea]|uniref:UDP-N-acetylglucosamine 2-epimerase n=1 Tax=Pandoraea TaxID=93217 RepID=UPI0003D1EDA9|nr:MULTISPECIES: UDP-N-acetylglucosamine 2-epimerase [Pandoraea]AHB75666.1 UDP-N-acetyl-D-glucosamine 2-epimerase, UDP-hydrolysing [Pandoraea pnomenusa]